MLRKIVANYVLQEIYETHIKKLNEQLHVQTSTFHFYL